MKIRFNKLFLIGLMCLMIPAAALSQENQEDIPALKDAAANILQDFPILNLFVIDVKDGDIIIEKDSQNRLKPGMELQAFREGKEFTHPVTGQVLGRFEESLGEVRIKDIQENYAVAEVISQKSGAAVSRGDKVRITSTRIKLAVPAVANLSGQQIDINHLTSELIYQLESSRRFEVMPSGELAVWLDKLGMAGGQKLNDPAQVRKLCEMTKTQGIVACEIKELNQTAILTVQLLSAVSGAAISKANFKLEASKAAAARPAPSNKFIESPAASSRSFIEKNTEQRSFTEPGVMRSQELDFGIRAMAVGDANGDGQSEVVVTDGKRVIIYQMKEGKLDSIWQEADNSHNHLALDMADINQNGTPEIFVTDYDKGLLRSYVLEYQAGSRNFVMIQDKLGYFLRVVDLPQGHRLIGQKLGVSEAFYGKPGLMKWDGSQYAAEKEMDLPSGISVYGFAVGDVNNDSRDEVVQIDGSEKLRVYGANGEIDWRSSDYYGGSNISFSRTSRDITAATGNVGGGLEQVRIRGRVLVADTDGNGVKEILVAQNMSSTGYLFPNSVVYDSSSMASLEWDGIGYTDHWHTKKQDAYIADFALADMDKTGPKKLVMALVMKKGLDKFLPSQKSIIIFSNL